MNLIPQEIIKYIINNYLTLSDKINLHSVDKRLNKIQKKTIGFHLGEIIADKLGISLKTINEDMDLLRQYKLDFLKEIINICFKEEDYYKKNTNIYGVPISLKNLIKIKKSNLSDCKTLLLDDNLNNNNKKYTKKKIISNYYRKNYYTSYALLF